MSLFRNPRDVSSFTTLTRQLVAGNSKAKALQTIYTEVTSQPYGYLFVDLKASTPERYKFLTNVFGEGPQLVYSLP